MIMDFVKSVASNCTCQVVALPYQVSVLLDQGIGIILTVQQTKLAQLFNKAAGRSFNLSFLFSEWVQVLLLEFLLKSNSPYKEKLM